MGKCIRKRAAVLLTAALLTAVLPWGFLSRTEKADSKDLKLNMTKVDGTYNKIEIYTPNVEGKLKSIIFVNGQGGPKTQEFAPYIEEWMQAGYIKPMVVFMPYFYNTSTDIPVFAKEMGTIADKIKAGSYDKSIGKTIDSSELSVCGYSMGGSVAGLAGTFFKDKFINVGELSPSPQLHYPCGGKYYVKDYCPYLYEQKDSDCKFSTASNKHLFMTVGSNEGDLTDGVEYGYNKYGKEQGFAKVVFTGDEQKHTSPIFRKELFCFMYYIQNNTMPSDELIYKVFGKGYTIDKVMPVKPDSPTPTNTNTPTPRPTNTNTPTPKPTNTNTPTPKPTNTNTPTPKPTNTNTPTPRPTNTNTPTPRPTNTNTPTPKPTNTNTPTPRPTNTNTPTPKPTNTCTPTEAPVVSGNPSVTPLADPDPSLFATSTPAPKVTQGYTPTATPTPVYVYKKLTVTPTASPRTIHKENGTAESTVTSGQATPTTAVSSSTKVTEEKVAAVKITEAINADKGISLKWTSSADAEYYNVLRRVNNGNFALVKVLDNSVTTFIDSAVENGSQYEYKIESINGKAWAQSEISSVFRLDTVKVKSKKSRKAKTAYLKWKKNPKADGYEIRYVLNNRVKSITVNKAKTVSKTIKKLKSKKKYQFAVRAYKQSGKIKSYGSWSKTFKIKIK